MPGCASIGEMMRFSWMKSSGILFPINFKRWFKILIIVWFAGAGIQGCSVNFHAPGKPANSSPEATPSTTSSQAPRSQPQALSPDGTRALPAADVTYRFGTSGTGPGRSGSGSGPVWAVLLVAGVVLLGISITLFFMWFSSRIHFVLLDTLVSGRPALRAPFKKHKEIGNSYFQWSLAFFGISLGILLIAGLTGWGLWWILKGHLVLGIAIGVPALLLVAAVFLSLFLMASVMRDLVLPLMYREKIPAMRAVEKFLKAEHFTFGKVFQYLLVTFGLWVVASLVQGLVSVLVAIGALIAGGLLALPGILIVKALPLLKIPLIFLGVLVAAAIVLAVIVTIGMVMLPAAIFFRVFALAYLTRIDPECDLLNFYREPRGKSFEMNP